MYMRRKCQECRLKKCLSVGMRPECVVPEVQCAVKRKEKKAQKEKDKPNSTTNGSPEMIKIEPEVSFASFISKNVSPLVQKWRSTKKCTGSVHVHNNEQICHLLVFLY